MRRAGGYAIWTSPDGPAKEADTLTCSHCQRLVFVQPKQDLGGFCRVCMKHICGPCADLGRCLTWEKQMEIAEARYRLRKAAGLE